VTIICNIMNSAKLYCLVCLRRRSRPRGGLSFTIFWTLQKCIVCLRSKEGPAGEHHSNILDSAEVHCLGLIPEKPAQPGLSEEEKQAQRGTIICNILDSVDALLRAADR